VGGSTRSLFCLLCAAFPDKPREQLGGGTMTAVRRILCPIDWSEPSGLALEAASRLVRSSEVELTVLHVLDTGWRGLPQPPVEAQYETEQSLRSLTIEMGLSRQQVHSLVKWGDPAAQICDVARKSLVDAIVLATHGSSGWKRWRLGSVAQRVCDSASCPILAIGPTAGHSCVGGIEFPFRRILGVADSLWTAMDAAAGLASQCESELFCLCPPGEEDLELADGALQQWAERNPYEVHVRRVTGSGDTASAVLEAANRHSTDLIVLDNSNRQYSGHRLTVTDILQRSRCPVWLQCPTPHERFESRWQLFRDSKVAEPSLLVAA
jgi:nucleotide-binding universal stress UspA family protein